MSRTAPDSAAPKTVTLRPPTVNDGAALWQLREDVGTLDANSPYAYLMACDRFAKSSVVAEADGRLVGFVCGIRSHEKPDTLFVWQVGVDPSLRGAGLARRMLADLASRDGGPRWIEATVTPSNEASRALFRSFAKSLGCACEVRPCYLPDHFPGDTTEGEDLFRIGPLDSTT